MIINGRLVCDFCRQPIADLKHIALKKPNSVGNSDDDYIRLHRRKPNDCDVLWKAEQEQEREIKG